MKSQRGYTLFEVIFIAVMLAAVGGWIANVVKFVGICCQTLDAWFVMRLVGIFVPPFGAIIGWL